MDQPVPQVNRVDVLRIVRRDFALNDEQLILELLSEYGELEWHREIDRVHLAILKLSQKSLDKLIDTVQIACEDFRDVISNAEYPNYSRFYPKRDSLDDGEKYNVITSDWDQYKTWLAS